MKKIGADHDDLTPAKRSGYNRPAHMSKGKNPHAIELGKLGRAVNSPRQQEAARENGKRGGRPSKGAKPGRKRRT